MCRNLVLALALALGVSGLGGCAADVGDSTTDDADDSATDAAPIATATDAAPIATATDASAIASFDEENIGTATEPLTDGQRAAMCAAAAAVAGSLGCAGVIASCGASAVLTVGTTSIPCVLLSAFACAGFAGGTSVIAAYCPQYVNK